MARKNLLGGLIADSASGGDDAEKPARAPRYSKGAIGAVSQSIADLKNRAILEIDPFQISEGGLRDRVEHDEDAHAQLMQSIREHGQQVPILVRPDPETEGRYRIVYGRRRVLALRDLGQPVKAMVRDLDDREAILAQGQENSARRDLSFVEKANFARQMRDAGYDRKVICDALSTDKTLISRLLQVADTLPVELIEHIGAAPGIGRDRWLALAALWGAQDLDTQDGIAMLAVQANARSDARFEGLFGWLEKRGGAKPVPSPAPRPVPQKRALTRADGKTLGQVIRRGDTLRIELSRKAAGGFDDWLAENIEEIHRDWLAKRDEQGR
ncbi:plasmid partitioning protein RepB [Salipiger sp. 1_MG-2023]|uniref:plasmid partitioning protein RepB n=1 Tax=Salipiger sp. 1_MG-2023 TaxID=3062665 RepID=UPI0026E29065|nr:plasmid partitioning protein RepB [Salipiger sp. 1_MG-2023]MDO6587790.1 plasmid partitioning protein RepB [Salipiger sp. 1_MG-2023]